MNESKRKQINILADKISNILDVQAPISDLELVVKQLSGKLEFVDSMPEFAEGKIRKLNASDQEYEFELTISTDACKERQRFSIAHELGHLFLHMGYLISEDLWNMATETYLRKYDGEMENEANEFAAAFLMPEKEFRKSVEENTENGKCKLQPIATKFMVSLDAVRNRGRWLKLFAWN